MTDAEAGDAKPDFYGINCSHPVEFKPALEPDDWVRRLRSLRPNAAKMDKVSLCSLGHIEEGDPEELGQLMGGLARRYPHIDIWGGCCGTWGQVFRRDRTPCSADKLKAAWALSPAALDYFNFGIRFRCVE